MGFNETLRLLLRDKNLKQAELCRMTGIQTSLMSEYLSGKKSPTIGNAILIADALHISLDTLVGKDTYSGQKENSTLSELYKVAEGLSEDERLCILDLINTYKKHLGKRE